MPHKNKLYHGSKLSEKKTREILRYFALDFTASDAARLSGVSVRSVNDLYLLIRQRIFDHCQAQSPFTGTVECDEAYFGPTRVRGKRGRGAGGKTIVFGLLKRGDCVYTEIVPDCSKATLQRIIRGHADPSCIVNTDGWPGYHGLVDVGFDKHFRVNHGNNEFVRGPHHVNGIESFWSFAKRRFVKFNGIPKHTFPLHLKETEFRFNHRKSGTFRALLNLISQQPLARSAS
jgi:transposase-like protein